MPPSEPHAMQQIVDGLPTYAAKIRALDARGYKRADIARFLGKPYQYVRTVLVQGPPKSEIGKNEMMVGRLSVRTQFARRPTTVQVGAGGRVVIPADIRAALGANEGDTLMARIEDGVLMLMTPETGVRKAQELVRRYIPEGVSLVDELIAERRAEAARESSE